MIDEHLIGREAERKILEDALSSNNAELVSVVGRRRVGKTFLVKSVYASKIKFSITGIPNVNKETQLGAFAYELNAIGAKPYEGKPLDNWLQAFFSLTSFLDQRRDNEKIVLFFDELPWLATHRSGFISAFSWLWNSWAVDKNVVIVICGSAASWMVQKIVRDRGGLHNRITRRIFVEPFDLYTTKKFLNHHGVRQDEYGVVQLYMAMGGIPHYLKEVKPGLTATQNIDEICFNKQGLLYDEFLNLYPAIFDEPERHLEIVRLLGKKPHGLSRKQLIEHTKLATGGRFTKILEELVVSGFVSAHTSFGKKQKTYRLIDEYSLFYLKFIEPMHQDAPRAWAAMSKSQSYQSWSGYAFENIGLRHIDQIKKALGITGVVTRSSAYSHKAKDGHPGIQVDLVIDRDDRSINLCEFKFYNNKVVLNKSTADQLRKKRWAFEHYTKTRKLVFWTLISPFGLHQNEHSLGLVDQSFELGVFF